MINMESTKLDHLVACNLLKLKNESDRFAVGWLKCNKPMIYSSLP